MLLNVVLHPLDSLNMFLHLLTSSVALSYSNRKTSSRLFLLTLIGAFSRTFSPSAKSFLVMNVGAVYLPSNSFIPAINTCKESVKLSSTGSEWPNEWLLTSRQKPSKNARKVRIKWLQFSSEMPSEAVISEQMEKTFLVAIIVS